MLNAVPALVLSDAKTESGLFEFNVDWRGVSLGEVDSLEVKTPSGDADGDVYVSQ